MLSSTEIATLRCLRAWRVGLRAERGGAAHHPRALAELCAWVLEEDPVEALLLLQCAQHLARVVVRAEQHRARAVQLLQLLELRTQGPGHVSHFGLRSPPPSTPTP